MMRLFHVYFPSRILVLAAVDAVLILFALVTAVFVWFGSDAELELLYEEKFLGIAVVAAACILCMYYYDLYDALIVSDQREVLLRLVQAFGTVCVVLALLNLVFPSIRLPRRVLFLGLALTALVLFGSRSLFVCFNRSTRLSQRTLFLGSGSLAQRLVEQIERRPILGMDIVGYLDRPNGHRALNGLCRLGEPEEVARVVVRERVNLVLFSIDTDGELPVEALLRMKASGVMVQDVARSYEATTGQVPVESLLPMSLLLSNGFRVSRAMLLYKRAASILGSILGLLVSAPLLAFIALLVKLDSPGPAIFRQRRIGKDGEEFTMYKFRSMRHSPERDVRPTEEGDIRVTRVGRFIRRLRLDELPQLYNILRGDMYLVGPRPFVPEVEETLARQIPLYRERWAVKPGVTGWAQIQKGYCATLQDNIEKLGFDLFYIKHLSIGLDCLILFQTIKIALLGRGAR